ncbi:MAG: PaaI family thioesterase [Lachnospiraceae bacterium]|nr:PaaI family thioesterase [Lachnospiraceae bacterium]
MAGTFNSLEEAREYFKKDRFATDAGISIDVLDIGRCVCSMTIDDRHRNANGGIMGGAIFTLGDLAFAVASNHIHKPTVAQQVSISFLRSASAGKLTAEAICLKDGRSSCVYNILIRDEKNKEIAQFVGTGFKL